MYIRQYKKKESKYWYKAFSKISPEEKMLRRFRSPIIDLILKYSGKKTKIIEGGCSEGDYLQVLKILGYQNIGGFEIDKGLLNNAKKKGLDVKYGDIRKIPYEDRSVELYLELGVVEHFHFDEQEKILKEINRILKKKGILIISFAYLNLIRALMFPYLYLKNLLIYKRIKKYSFHQYIYSKKEMSSLLDRCGFYVIETITKVNSPRAIIVARKK